MAGTIYASIIHNLYNNCPDLSSPVDNFAIFYIIQELGADLKLPSHGGGDSAVQSHAPDCQKIRYPLPPASKLPAVGRHQPNASNLVYSVANTPNLRLPPRRHDDYNWWKPAQSTRKRGHFRPAQYNCNHGKFSAPPTRALRQ